MGARFFCHAGQTCLLSIGRGQSIGDGSGRCANGGAVFILRPRTVSTPESLLSLHPRAALNGHPCGKSAKCKNIFQKTILGATFRHIQLATFATTDRQRTLPFEFSVPACPKDPCSLTFLGAIIRNPLPPSPSNANTRAGTSFPHSSPSIHTSDVGHQPCHPALSRECRVQLEKRVARLCSVLF